MRNLPIQPREFKFRVWDKATNRMSPDFVLFGEFLLIGAIFSWLDEGANKGTSIRLERLNDLVVMQATGMKDKNGIEVYEGDFVKSDLDFDEDHQLPRAPGLITFVNGSFFTNYDTDFSHNGNLTLAELLDGCNAEVVGNVFTHSKWL